MRDWLIRWLGLSPDDARDAPRWRQLVAMDYSRFYEYNGDDPWKNVTTFSFHFVGPASNFIGDLVDYGRETDE